jgi:hypothetical protein
MASSPVQGALEAVVKATATELAPLGFRRRGFVLRIFKGPMCGIIQFQRGSASTKDRVTFTVNVGVVCGLLLPERIRLADSQIADAHAWRRLGKLADGLDDKWWTIDGATDAATLAKGLSDLVLRSAVPFIETYMSPPALIELWESGKSFGLTEGQRRDLLSRLKKSLASPPSLVGMWSLDPSDTEALAQLGDVVLEFRPDGWLTYTVRGRDSDQLIKLRYSIQGSTIVTDQESAPRMERTRFEVSDEGVLSLDLDGVPCRFLRMKP